MSVSAIDLATNIVKLIDLEALLDSVLHMVSPRTRFSETIRLR
jgi:hypothetical protein